MSTYRARREYFSFRIQFLIVMAFIVGLYSAGTAFKFWQQPWYVAVPVGFGAALIYPFVGVLVGLVVQRARFWAYMGKIDEWNKNKRRFGPHSGQSL